MKNKMIVLFLVVCASLPDFANAQAPVAWNGYTQVRASSNFDDKQSFSLRRMKLWVKSTPGFSEKWSFLVLSTTTSLQQERYFLQDAKIGYKTGAFKFDFGQFKPAYSLQQFQSDAVIPAIERATVIDRLYINGSLGQRDIGMEVKFQDKSKWVEIYAGLFNGYGINEYRFYDNEGFLATHKTAFNIKIAESNTLQIGYSLAFRKADNLKIKKVLPETLAFTGDDFRYNVFVLYQNKFVDLQAEYLTADFDGQQASGYYLESTFNFNKNQIMLHYGNYIDLIDETKDEPYYRMGYNYLINKHKIKLMFDNYFQIYDDKIQNYIVSFQLQIYFK